MEEEVKQLLVGHDCTSGLPDDIDGKIAYSVDTAPRLVNAIVKSYSLI